MIRIFLGFDPRETIAFHVAAESIHAHSSSPVSIAPLRLSQLKQVFDRPRDPKQSTDFSFSRFLVPQLCNFEGWALFADCDILVRRDIAELWSLRDDRYAVRVVKHDHQPAESHKFLGHVQTTYARKNWSSVMLFNCAKCRALTPDYVETAAGLDLHQFRWLDDDALIGDLPPEWNVLVGHDAPSAVDSAALLHFTVGGPWFAEFRDTAKADLWRSGLQAVLQPIPAKALVGDA